MSEPDGNGSGNGANLKDPTHEALTDELVLTLNRGDGTMGIGGKVINHDVALDMCQRGCRFFEQQLRMAGVLQAKQQMVDQERVNELLNRTRGGRG